MKNLSDFDNQFTLNKTQLSDLFFNSELPNKTEFYNNADGNIEQGALREALTKDALDFAGTFSNGTEREELAEALTNDFLERM